MKAQIADILKDLYTLDPAWKTKEEEIIKIIEKLLSSRPDVELDENFKQELKAKLIRQLEEKQQQKKKNRLTKIISISGSAAAVVFILVISVIATVSNIDKSNYAAEMQTEETKKMEAYVAELEKTDRSRTVKDKMVAADESIKGRAMQPEPLAMYSGLAEMPDNTKGGRGVPDAADQSPDNISTTGYNTEEYDRIYENEFQEVMENPLSTFSIDVDTASYANVRRFIENNQLPYPDAVRIEELINYFTYTYPEPTGSDPFSFTTEIAACPWNKAHKLLLIGMQGKKIDAAQLPASNLVFLLDVSGSMESHEKLPLLKIAFKLLVNNLRPADRVAIVVYAGAAGLVLDSTPGSRKQEILDAIDNLEAGGSTAGGAGIELAYRTAAAHYLKSGNNRVILATDGDFNVGASSDSELVRMIEQKRNQGIFLTVLGFGMGNYKDAKMEQLADKGNGNYAYIDNILEAKKVLVNQMGATLFTIAKDVKIQIEFNPVKVKSYRLIGYENRVLAARDFEDDTKDAGELGAGHNVTALYELVPAGETGDAASLKYQKTTVTENALTSPELLTLKFRYKAPEAETSKLMEIPVLDDNRSLSAASENFRFAAAVAQWGLLLRDSKFKADAGYAQVLDLAGGALGNDPSGYRAEFITLVKKSAVLSEVRQ